MAEVKKARLFLRRGTDTDRKLTTLCEGELGYSTDAFRVVVGDGTTAGGRSLGSTVFVSGGTLAANSHTNLTTASAHGLALSGDFAVFPAATYKKADGNEDSVPSASATNVMLLTGSDASAAASWVAVNSGIPYGNIDVQDNDISGDYVSGGTISGPVTLSGGQVNIGGNTLGEDLVLSGVALSAATVPTGTLVYPLGLTSTAQLTCIDSIYKFGTQTSSSGLGNSTGYVPATGTTTSNVISAYVVTSGFTVSTSAMGIGTCNHGATKAGDSNKIEVFPGTGYMGSFGLSANNTGRTYIPNYFQTVSWPKGWIGRYVAAAEFNYSLDDFQLAAENISWDDVVEFYFSVFYKHVDDGHQFIGFYNHQTSSNEILHWNGSSIDGGAMRTVPNAVTVTIPNTVASGAAAHLKTLSIHLGLHGGSAGFAFTGLRYKW